MVLSHLGRTDTLVVLLIDRYVRIFILVEIKTTSVLVCPIRVIWVARVVSLRPTSLLVIKKT